jgi:hypothetical protein
MGWAICSSNAAVAEAPTKGPRFHPKLLRTHDILVKPIGEGGFGVVYLSTHLKTGEKHAIKARARRAPPTSRAAGGVRP